jgi:hypothetical protein
MDDDARRLVDDEQVLVLPGDPKVDLFPLERLWLLGRQLDLELLPTLEPVALCANAAVDAYRAGLDQALRYRARSDLRLLGEEPVETVARRLVRNAKPERLEPAADVLASVAGAAARRGGRGRRAR